MSEVVYERITDKERRRAQQLDITADIIDEKYDIAFVYVQTSNRAKCNLDGPPGLMADILAELVEDFREADPMPDRYHEIGAIIGKLPALQPPTQNTNFAVAMLEMHRRHFEKGMKEAPYLEAAPEQKQRIDKFYSDITEALAKVTTKELPNG